MPSNGAGQSADHRHTLGAFIAELGTEVSLDQGRVLFREGDRSRSVYACVSGRINLFVTSPNGREIILGTKTPIQGFGELSAITDVPRTATAIAMEPTTVVGLAGTAFLDDLGQQPELSLAVLRELAAQLRRTNLRFSARAEQSTTLRVGMLLIELAAKFHRHGADCGQIEIPVTQDEIASWVGSTREAAARSLATLRREQAITTGRSLITIIDAAKLQAVIDEAMN